MKTKKNKFMVVCLILTLLTTIASAQTGGDFAITQSVIAAGGGQQSTGGSFSLDGTIGQAAAGNAISGAPFAVTSGFWNFNALAPTAANASISGRILAADGRGIRNVIVSLTNALGGEIRFANSGSFGYYRFEDIPVSETYILTVRSKRFVFVPDTRVITLLDELTELNFTALPK